MRISTFGTTLLGSLTAIVLLAGCTNSASESTGVLGHSDYAAHRALPPSIVPPGIQLQFDSQPQPGVSFNNCPLVGPLIFLSDPTIPEIYIFKGTENGNTFPCGAILHNQLVTPEGMDVDGNNCLWVANTLASNILRFCPPYTGAPFPVINDAGQYPVGIEADCKGMWVTHAGTTTGQPGSVQQFAGAVMVGLPKTDPNASAEFFPACDPAHNLFTTYLDYSTPTPVGHVNEFTFASGYVTILEPPITLTYPGGIDYEDGTLLVGDQTSRTITPCPGGVTPCGAPIVLSMAMDPVTFDVNAQDEDLLTADFMTTGFQQYDYPVPTFDKQLKFGGHRFVGIALRPDDDDNAP